MILRLHTGRRLIGTSIATLRRDVGRWKKISILLTALGLGLTLASALALHLGGGFARYNLGLSFGTVIEPGQQGLYRRGSGLWSWTRPVHRVLLTRPYALGTTEIDRATYLRFARETGRDLSGLPWASATGSELLLPANYIRWYDAIAFCNWLSIKENRSPVYSLESGDVFIDYDANGYRLPSEAEWEYAARKPIYTSLAIVPRYPGSNRLDKVAWYSNNSGEQLQYSGQKAPTSDGLYDLGGNLWEWTNDWFAEDGYSPTPQLDPQGVLFGAGRVIRGGSFRSVYFMVDGAFRTAELPQVPSPIIGFRVLKPLF